MVSAALKCLKKYFSFIMFKFKDKGLCLFKVFFFVWKSYVARRFICKNGKEINNSFWRVSACIICLVYNLLMDKISLNLLYITYFAYFAANNILSTFYLKI